MHCRLLAVTLLASLVLGQEIPNVPVETNQRPGEVVGQWESTNNNVGADPVGPPQKTDDLPEYLRKLARQLKKYQRIENTEVGGLLMGWPGLNGQPGAPGRNGLNGVDGAQGPSGPAGETGVMGPVGAPGVEGISGPAGPRGPAGAVGVPGPVGRDGRAAQAKWKQCAWSEESDLDNGVIKACNFTKSEESTHLHVRYSGNLRVGGCSNCCKRWFFTFNNRECTSPMGIDAAIYLVGPSNENLLRPRTVEGYCHVPAGATKVGFHVGNCEGFGNADAYEGWHSVSRIIVEEVAPPQE